MILQFDGGARPNPGKGGCGACLWALHSTDTEIAEQSIRTLIQLSNPASLEHHSPAIPLLEIVWPIVGECSNNRAELLGLYLCTLLLSDLLDLS